MASHQTTARQAIFMAASRARTVTSLTMTLTEHSAVVAPFGLTGTIQMRIKPTPLADAKWAITYSGQTDLVEEIQTSKANYFKTAGLADRTGKPWFKISLAMKSSKTGRLMAQLLPSLQNSNPLTRTRLFTASKDVHKVGTQVINGVQTTEYAGSYESASSLAMIPPNMRTIVGATRYSIWMTRTHFFIWIDGNHLIRKVVEQESVAGQVVTMTIIMTAVNQPVTVTLPSASGIAQPANLSS